jgi:hypothetical protein
MNIVRKKIGGREYVYTSEREGDRIVQRYIGPGDSPHVKSIIEQKRDLERVPERLRALFWDADLARIDLRRNARYIIERVLEFGSLADNLWLQKVYSGRKIMDVLIFSRNITDKSRAFWGIWYDLSE